MTIKHSIPVLLLLSLFQTAYAQLSSHTDFTAEESTVRKKPLSFTHQPFLLVKVTPTAIFGRYNVFQYGAELAPPFGKFSFGFDYGKGKGSWSLNKEQKEAHPEQTTQIIRGEIRAYFSDWYPFYALDKKPFGRYYAIEYVDRKLTYDYNPAIRLYGGGSVNSLTFTPVAGHEQALHVKLGKHFLISRWFFIDGFAGIGVGRFDYAAEDLQGESEPVAFSFSKPVRNGDTKGYFLSKTAGVRLCLPL